MTWTRDRVRRLSEIQRQAGELSLKMQALIHELDPASVATAVDALIAANEELTHAEGFLHIAADSVKTIYELSDALGEMAYTGI